MWLPSQNRWTLIDFGCAARIGQSAHLGFSLLYAAPEDATASYRYDTESDAYTERLTPRQWRWVPNRFKWVSNCGALVGYTVRRRRFHHTRKVGCSGSSSERWRSLKRWTCGRWELLRSSCSQESLQSPACFPKRRYAAHHRSLLTPRGWGVIPDWWVCPLVGLISDVVITQFVRSTRLESVRVRLEANYQILEEREAA